MSHDILVGMENGVCTITINRPERRNALTPDGFRELAGAVGAAGSDADVRVIVLRGASEQAFCAGLDLEGYISRRAVGGAGQEACRAIESCPCPVIAMVYGYVLGGGLGLAISCDLSVAGDNTRAGLTMVKVGEVYSADGIDRFIRTIGLAATRRMMYTGRIFNAEESLRMGLFNEVVPLERMEKATYDLAREISENAPLSIRATKESVRRVVNARPLSPDLAKDLFDLRARVLESEDSREGRRAFAEKRKPEFKGK